MNRDDLLIASQQALLGAISPQILAVLVDFSDSTVRLWAYAEAELSDEERDALDVAVTEIIAALRATAQDYKIIEHAKQPLKYPGWGSWVFLRLGCLIDWLKDG